MSDDPELRHADLETLVNQFLDDTLSDEGMRQLDCLLNESPAARTFFLQFTQLHIEIGVEATVDKHADKAFSTFCLRHDRIEAAAKCLVGGASAKRSSNRNRGQKLALRLATAASVVWGSMSRRPAAVFTLGILTASLCYQVWSRLLADRQGAHQVADHSTFAERGVNPTAVPVARLTYLNGCSWGGSSPQFTSLDSQVQLGDEITLHEGIAEFRLSSGVSLSIEGPAALVITSPTSLVLQHGRTTVYVPPDIAEFRLVAAGCRITCRAAEFGVQVAGGDVDIHAFSGQIEAAPALLDERVTEVESPVEVRHEADLPAGAEFAKVVIQTKRGLELASHGDDTLVSRWHPADESRFATRLTMAGRLPITKKYVDSVLKSKPIGYWRFEKPTDGVVANENGGLAGLAIAGNVDFVGDAKNRSLELGRPGSSGFLTCKNELNLPRGSDYSVEIWMKPSHNHLGGLVAMNVRQESERADPGAFCLLTWTKGRQYLRYLHRDPPGLDPKVGTDCCSDVPYRLRRWQHVVTVKRGPDMEIYLDGKLVGAKRDESSLAPHLCIIVGASGIPRGGVPMGFNRYRFIGQLDELSIYARALDHDEIKQHIDAVKWDAGRGDDVRVEGI